MRPHVPLQHVVRPRRDVRLLPRHARLQHQGRRDRGHGRRRPQGGSDRRHAEGDDRGQLAPRDVHRRPGLRRADGEARRRSSAARRAGPMEGIVPFVGEMLGVERAPIEVIEDGLSHSVRSATRSTSRSRTSSRSGSRPASRSGSRRVPSGRIGVQRGRGEALEDQRLRHLVRGQDRDLDLRVLLGRLVSAHDGEPGARSRRSGRAPPAAARSGGESGAPAPSVTGAIVTITSSSRPASANCPARSPPPTIQTFRPPAAATSSRARGRHRRHELDRRIRDDRQLAGG